MENSPPKHFLFYYVLLRKNESVNNKILHIIINIWFVIHIVIQDYNKVAYNHSSSKFQQGCGILDTLMSPFTAEKFSGERHAYSLSPSTFFKPMNFMGPHTRLDL